MEEFESSVSAEPIENVVGSQQTEDTTQSNEQVETAQESVNTGEFAEHQAEEKPVQSAEENARYAQIRRDAEAKAEVRARDRLIEEMYGSQGIHTYAEYQAAVQASQEQERVNQLIQHNIPEEYAREMIENQKFRQQYEDQQRQIQRERATQKDLTDFVEAYPDVKAEDIPNEVWEANAKGIPMQVAYAIYENATLKEKIAQYEKGTKAAEVNKKNADGAIGSVNGQGQVPSGFITKDVFEANKNNQSWMNKNYDALVSSMGKW